MLRAAVHVVMGKAEILKKINNLLIMLMILNCKPGIVPGEFLISSNTTIDYLKYEYQVPFLINYSKVYDSKSILHSKVYSLPKSYKAQIRRELGKFEICGLRNYTFITQKPDFRERALVIIRLITAGNSSYWVIARKNQESKEIFIRRLSLEFRENDKIFINIRGCLVSSSFLEIFNQLMKTSTQGVELSLNHFFK